MPKVQTNLVCKVTSHLKSKTHNIALSDAVVRMTWALVPDADACHLAKANVTNSKSQAPEFYVMPQCKGISTDSTVCAGI